MHASSSIALVMVMVLSFSILFQPARSTQYSFGWHTVNFDSGFSVSETETFSLDNYSYWHPSTHGNVNPQCGQQAESQAYIVPGTLHTLQNDTGSIGWNCYDDTVAQTGDFPWQGTRKHCETQEYQPDWVCPRNSNGLQAVAQSDFSDRVSANLTFNQRNTPTSGLGRYNIFLDFYFWFDRGNHTGDRAHGCSAGNCTYAWMEAMVKLACAEWTVACACWTDTEPIGGQGTFDAGTNFGYHRTVAQLAPSLSYTLSDYNITQLYRDAMTLWGLDPNTHAVLLGIEVGTEGYGSALSVDFQNIKVETCMPDVAFADLNFDHAVNILDVAFAADYYGRCPNNKYQYAWVADVVSQEGSSSCIDILDLASIAFYYGQSY